MLLYKYRHPYLPSYHKSLTGEGINTHIPTYSLDICPKFRSFFYGTLSLVIFYRFVRGLKFKDCSNNDLIFAWEPKKLAWELKSWLEKIPSISIFLKDWSWSRHTEKLQYSNFFQGLILKGFTELINFVLSWLFIEGKKWSQRWLSLKHDFHWKTTIVERQPSMEKDLWWRTTFYGRRPLM